jgi:oligosaccharyl transferase complex subunit OST4
MISDSTLYTLSIFLGTLAMLLIILYHYLEINAVPAPDSPEPSFTDSDKSAALPPQHGRSASGSANMNTNTPSAKGGSGAREKFSS